MVAISRGCMAGECELALLFTCKIRYRITLISILFLNINIVTDEYTFVGLEV